jgi:hypothetical protein
MDDEIAELWRQLAINIARCEHGRIQGDPCFSCSEGVSPDQTGRGIGYSLDGACRLVVPPREKMNDPRAWYVRLVA